MSYLAVNLLCVFFIEHFAHQANFLMSADMCLECMGNLWVGL